MMRRPDSRAIVAGGAAAAMAISVYLTALHNPFVYDDYHTVIENASIRSVTDLRAIFWHDVTRPIVNLSYAVDRAMWGPSPFGFHLTSVLFHALNVVLLFCLARRVRLDVIPAFAAAALLAVHPMATEAVGYVSGRSEVLCLTLLLVALLCADRWLRGGGWQWLAAMLAVWIAALTTKETAAMFPFVLVLYDWLQVDRLQVARPFQGREGGAESEGGPESPALQFSRRFRTVYGPLIALTVLAGLARVYILARIEYPGQVSLHWRYLLVDADVFRRYLGMMAVPTGQALFHEVGAISSLFELRALAGIGVVAAVVAAIWWMRRSEWLISLGLAWFALLLVPSAVLIALDQGEPMTEHRVYVASAGLFLAVGAGISRIVERLSDRERLVRRAGAVVLALVLLSFVADTLLRNEVWRSPVTLWRESVDLAPKHPRPRLLLGEALADSGRRDEAIQQFRIAISFRPSDPVGHVELARSLGDAGRWREAREELVRALEVGPHYEPARQALRVLDEIQSHFGSDGSGR
jgi:protein O-mannosyl-transferase